MLDSCATDLCSESLGCLNALTYLELILVYLTSTLLDDESVSKQHGHFLGFGSCKCNFSASRIIHWT